MTGIVLRMCPLLGGWILDHVLGDPAGMPHPVVWFGRLIAAGERKWNKGTRRMLKGAVLAVMLIAGVYVLTDAFLWALRTVGGVWTEACVSAVLVFYCLAGTTLKREVRDVFRAVDRSLDEGRKQVARIVGRDTQQLSAQEVRTAALETLAENLSDGVIAPLFWYMLLGVPGMMAYKMVNTLDSMIGYRTERYQLFGRVAARTDDVANYVPARLTACLMTLVSGRLSLFRFVARYGRQHASPNSGFPEAALAGILDCRFGGPHDYFGKTFWKPYIGSTERDLTSADCERAIRINTRAEVLMVVLVLCVSCLLGS